MNDSNSTRNLRIRHIAEVGLAVALAFILAQLKIPFAPTGGSISLSMLPIVVLALLRGPAIGVLTGTLFGVLDMAFGGYIINAAQAVLDYPIAYGLVGLAGFFRSKNHNGITLSALAIAGTLIGALARFAAHLVSGVIYFPQAGITGTAAWVASATYNLGYLAPSTLAVAVVAAIALPILRQTTGKMDSKEHVQ